MLERKGTLIFQGPNGTGEIEIRHKWDGCWEIYYQEPGFSQEHLIHIEQEDMKSFVQTLVQATEGE